MKCGLDPFGRRCPFCSGVALERRWMMFAIIVSIFALLATILCIVV